MTKELLWKVKHSSAGSWTVVYIYTTNLYSLLKWWIAGFRCGEPTRAWCPTIKPHCLWVNGAKRALQWHQQFSLFYLFCFFLQKVSSLNLAKATVSDLEGDLTFCKKDRLNDRMRVACFPYMTCKSLPHRLERFWQVIWAVLSFHTGEVRSQVAVQLYCWDSVYRPCFAPRLLPEPSGKSLCHTFDGWSNSGPARAPDNPSRITPHVRGISPCSAVPRVSCSERSNICKICFAWVGLDTVSHTWHICS